MAALSTVHSNKTACCKYTLGPGVPLPLEAAFIKLDWFASSRGRNREGKDLQELSSVAPRKAESYQITGKDPSFSFVTKLS